jgi:hypothetical protein
MAMEADPDLTTVAAQQLDLKLSPRRVTEVYSPQSDTVTEVYSVQYSVHVVWLVTREWWVSTPSLQVEVGSSPREESNSKSKEFSRLFKYLIDILRIRYGITGLDAISRSDRVLFNY